jgi:penicillin-binding protein activator
MKRTIIALAVVAVLLIAGCATPSRTVQRTAADAQIDLSGRWNDTDSRLVAEQMISSLLNGAWLNNFRSAEGRPPVVIVGSIRNRSSEHIDTNTFIKDIERELVNSGMVKFVANPEQREQLRAEKMDQQTQASRETIKRLGEETGADFMLQGNISSVTDAVEGRRVVSYQTDLELIGIETNEKVWIDSKEIKKYIEQKKAKW